LIHPLSAVPHTGEAGELINDPKDPFMKNARLVFLTLALTATTSGVALANESAPKSREQVRAELAQAQDNGTLIANSESGATYRDLAPNNYPTRQATTTKTRDQVKAELAEARRSGNLMANNQTGATYRDLYPNRYPTMNDAGAAMLGLAPLPNETRMN
jgi:hypothetical protein